MRESASPVVMDILSDSYEAMWNCRSLSQEDVDAFIRYPATMIGSDGSSLSTEGPLSGGNPHPRNFGAFPRVLSEYVRRRGVLRLEDAVRKMPSLPAQRFSLNDRGTLDQGMWADIVVFDLDAVRGATFENSKQFGTSNPGVGNWGENRLCQGLGRDKHRLDTPGLAPNDLTRLEWRKVRRPIYPLDDLREWQPVAMG